LDYYTVKLNDTDYKRELTPDELSTLTDIRKYFFARVGFNKKNGDPINQTA